jgi:anti-sigma regulatory factor (Ser/Thr protein kinase)
LSAGLAVAGPEADLTDWPLSDVAQLGALTSTPSCARRRARRVLAGWALARLAEPAELLISELVTNAVQASWALTSPGPVRLWLGSDGAGLLIEVWDAGPRHPRPATRAADDAEGGRGLLLVAALSACWGWYPSPGTAGKITWAIVAG